MNLSVNSTYSTTLAIMATNVPVVINFTTVIIGTIGGICNLITFTAAQLRRNSCVFYLFFVTIFQILSILFIIPTRMALDNFDSQLERQSIIFCKTRYYLSIIFPKLVTYFMLLAIVDRCLLTSTDARIRACSQLRVAHRVSIALLIMAPALAIHCIFFYAVYKNTCQVPPGTVYTILFTVYLIGITLFLPYALMLIFSMVTISNLHKQRRRISPAVGNSYQLRSKRFESQIIKIIVVQVIISTILISLRLGSYTYATVTSGNSNKTPLAMLFETFFLRLGIALFYFSFAISFYVSTLSSRYFRKIFWKRVRSLYQRVSG